ncbi:MAG: DUF1488 family protein, partial [Pseudolabrys sp.]
MSANDPKRTSPTASGENADRKGEIAFRCDSLMLFGDAFDAIARVARIPVRSRTFLSRQSCHDAVHTAVLNKKATNMAITFPNRSRSYDATRRAVRFWGYDRSME